MTNFVKADSTNLPKMQMITIISYLGDSSNHNVAELRGAKALMASRTAYLETSIGYVEVRRQSSTCTVRSKVVPEHRIRDKAYSVTVNINEKDEEIINAECDGCAAASGGCKHTIVMLFWLSKRTEEPACTSVQCYWKKPQLIDARTVPVETRHIFKNSKTIVLKPKDENVLQMFQQECKNHNIKDSLITSFIEEKETFDQYSLFDMMLNFVHVESDHSFIKYKAYIDTKISDEVKKTLSEQTIKQAESKLWHS